MSQINPLAFAYAQTPLAQRQQAAERDAEIQKQGETLKNAGYANEEGDLFVESTHEVDPVDDDTRRESAPRRPRKPLRKKTMADETPDDPPHLDIQA